MVGASLAQAKRDLQEQLELAYDIEDWRRVRQLQDKIRELELETGTKIKSNVPDVPDLPDVPPFAGGGTGFLCPAAAVVAAPNRRVPADQPFKHRARSSRSPRHRNRAKGHPADVPAERRNRAPVGEEGSMVIERNKQIKHLLQRNKDQEARAVLEEMYGDTIATPNTVTYNEFLGHFAKQKDMNTVFRFIQEMRDKKVQPNRVTGSIVIKSLDENSEQGDIDRTVTLLQDVIAVEGVDDILVSSLAEATVKVGYRGHKIYATLRHSLEQDRSWSVQTCGSLIRAHGYAKDVASIWKCWDSLIARGVQPTEVTTGCMVEQLVLNNQVEQAHRVIRDLDGRGFSDCVNAVVYSSLLKGYARGRDPRKVWALYQEMKSRRIQLKVETYNALVGAFSDCGMMNWVPGLFQDMYASGICPSVRTFTRLAKGFCLQGDMKKAEDVMKEMRTSTGLKPDEIFYNTILDAYAQHGDKKGGFKLLKRMEEEGFGKSKYTITIVRKLNQNAQNGGGGTGRGSTSSGPGRGGKGSSPEPRPASRTPGQAPTPPPPPPPPAPQRA